MNSVFNIVKNHATRMKRMPPAAFSVLVVDDEEPVRKFVERVLREAGYKTTTAADGPEAIEVAKKMESLDILVTDVMMPQMTGDELARRLRQTEQRGLKVLYLTGFSDRLFKEKVTLWARRSVPRQAVRRAGAAAGGVAAAVRPARSSRRHHLLKDARPMPQSASLDRDRRLFDESPEPTWLYDEETLRFLDVNRAALAVYGYTRDEFLQLTIHDLQAASADRPGQQAGASLRGEFRHQTKNGDQIDVEVVGSRLTFDGRQTRLEIVRDVSFELAVESQLRHAQNIETVGRLAGGIAHDFNNVLAAIVGHIEVLSDYLAPGDPRSAEVQAIRDAAELAADLTRQLVVFSSKQRLQQTVLNLNDVIERARTGLQRLMRDSVVLETRPAGHLWSVNADAGQIFQIVLNLVVNARDAMPDGGVVTLETANVTIGPDVARRRSIEPGDYVELSVQDTGTGIPPEVRVRLFEPFFTTKDRRRGTGLGLSTVYGIVKQSGGHIIVDSEVGRGSKFVIYLRRRCRRKRRLPNRRPARADRKRCSWWRTTRASNR